MWSELALSFQSGNGYVLAILIVGFMSLVVVLERFVMLQFVFNLDYTKFLRDLRKTVAADDLDRAVALCKSSSNTSLPKITLRALEAAETDPSTIRGTIEEETIEFLPRLERRLHSLPAFATIILLVGILGTIDALWVAFHSISVLDTAKKQVSLSTGVASSLNPTAIGLLFCMMILVGHQFLRGMAARITDNIHYGVTALTNLLAPPEVAQYVAGPATAAPARSEAGEDFVSEAKAPEEEGSGGNESFDDVSIEDIKDEEEII